jgi:hypothetical protein
MGSGIIFVWLLFGVASIIVASQKNRSGCAWFALGFLLGPFGLLFILLLPSLTSPTNFPSPPDHPPKANSPRVDMVRKKCLECGFDNFPNAATCKGCGASFVHPFSSLAPDGQASLDHETKKCPQCAEIIKLEAKKCRYCGEIFDPKEVENIVRAHLAPLEEERARLAKEMARRAEGQSYCPGCDRWDKHPHAALGDGGIGPWCPHCKQPAKDSFKRCPRCEQWDILTTIALPDGRYILWCPNCKQPIPE